MDRFWPTVKPILTSLRPRSIVYISGRDDAGLSELRGFAHDHDAVLDVIEPAGSQTDRQSIVEMLPALALEADTILIDAQRGDDDLDAVLALLDGFTPAGPGGFPLCLLHSADGEGTQAALDRFLSVSSRDLASASLAGRDELVVVGERDLVSAVRDLPARTGAHIVPALAEAEGRVSLLDAVLAQRESYVEALEAALLEQADQLHGTWSSPYWRLTAPLRQLVTWYRAGRSRLRSQRGRRQEVTIPLASLDWAELWTPEAGRRARWWRAPEIGIATAWRLEQPSPSRITYRLAAPAGSAFSSRVSVRRSVWAASKSAARVHLRLLGEGGVTLDSASAELDAQGPMGRRSSAVLGLAFSSDQADCRLVLEAETLEATSPRATVAWEEPALLVPAAGYERVRGLAASRSCRGARRGADPTISVVMPVHDPPPVFLERAIDSVLSQTYADWQLCLADDGSSDTDVIALLESYAARDERISLVRREEAGGISAGSNAALNLATGEYVALLDHDDELESDALEKVVAYLRDHPDADVVYTDEDRLLGDGTRFGGVLKPGWSPELLRSGMYTCHLGVYRRRLVEELGGFRGEFDGSQDFDLMLRLSERTDRIGHVPGTLYHWRASDASVAVNPAAKPYAYEAGERAVQAHLDRTEIPGEARRTELPGLYRVIHRVDPDSRASIVLALEGDGEQGVSAVVRCLNAIAQTTAHPAWEAICAAGETAAGRLSAQAGHLGDHLRVVTAAPEDTRGARIDRAVAEATGDHVIVLDAPCRPLDEGWLDVLLGFASLSGVGAVGAKVLRPDGLIEHAGVVLGEGLPLPAYRGVRGNFVGYLGTLSVACNYLAVAGVVAVPRELLRRLGGFGRWPGLLGATDFCLRAHREGFRTAFAPDARLALLDSPPAAPVPLAELGAFKRTWRDAVPADPYYHPSFWTQRAAFPSPSAS